ncbi:pyroglutamyl-peptidase I [Ranunculus cassubicifolius]
MGSEGPIPVTIHVTGFKKFHGVENNPTETIVSNLSEFLKQRGSSCNGRFTLGSCTVLQASGDEILNFLYKEEQSPRVDQRVVWLHFGASGRLTRFAIERQAVNEATFYFPDEHGWQPTKLSVVPEDGDLHQTRQTTCSVEKIGKQLKQQGFDVGISNDAGRFVCNYIYYHSLRIAEEKGHTCIFVHVPLFSIIDEDIQMEFAAAMLEAIVMTV